MQLLYGSSVPVPQFASLSLLLAEGMAEPLTAVAPNATCSTQAATLVVEDLHSHVRSIIQSSKSSTNGSMDFASELLREEEPSLVTTQIFRSGAGNGIGLHFRFLRGNSDNNLLQALVLDLIKSSPGKIDPATRVLGVLICVAVSGWGMIHCTASIPYSLSQRIDDCIQYLTSTSRHCDLIMAKSLLTVFLLTQDDHRISTKMMEAPNLLVFPGSDDRSRGLLSPLGMISPIAEFGRTARRASTGIVRGVISAGAGIGGAHTNSLSQADSGAATQADSSIPVRMDPTSSDSARCMTEKLTLLSVSESATILRRYTNTGRERMANLDLTSGTKSRFRRRKADIRVADFDQFDFKGPAKQSIAQRENKAIPAPLLTPEVVPGKLQLKSSSKDTKRGVPGTRRMSTHSNNRDEESAHRPMHSPKGDSGDPLNQKKIQKTQFDDETYDSRSHSGNYDANSVMSQDRMQVSIALNEDMTCSYKLSQLSSCVVEGVVQVRALVSVSFTVYF